VTVTDDEIAAVNLRTGRLYWSYQRLGAEFTGIAVEPSGLYVLWKDGLLVRMNPRTAAIDWQHQLGSAADAVAIGATAGSAAGGTAFVVTPGEIQAVSEATGSPTWTARAPGKCTFAASVMLPCCGCMTVTPAPGTGSAASHCQS
jgi:outer membrane protein assembly factor BamB